MLDADWSDLPCTAEARGLSGPELAREVSRQRLIRTGTGWFVGSFIDEVLLASAVGLGASEIQRIAGCSRQTVYNAAKSPLRARARGGSYETQLAVMALVAGAGGAIPASEAERLLKLPITVALEAISSLAAEGYLQVDAGGRVVAETSVSLTTEGEQLLRRHFDDMFLSHPDGTAVYVAVAADEAEGLLAAARQTAGERGQALLEAALAPSVMDGPELVFVVHAASGRRAFQIAQILWDQARQDAHLLPAAMRVVELIPPHQTNPAESLVLDAFLEAAAQAAPDCHYDAERLRRAYTGAQGDKALAQHMLTLAARCLRRSVGQTADPRTIRTGDEAFAEHQVAHALRVDAPRERVQEPLSRALILATDRLGPLPGGRIGSLPQPDGTPHIVETSPAVTQDELVAIAALAGQAVGCAIAAGYVRSAEQLPLLLAVD